MAKGVPSRSTRDRSAPSGSSGDGDDAADEGDGASSSTETAVRGARRESSGERRGEDGVPSERARRVGRRRTRSPTRADARGHASARNAVVDIRARATTCVGPNEDRFVERSRARGGFVPGHVSTSCAVVSTTRRRDDIVIVRRDTRLSLSRVPCDDSRDVVEPRRVHGRHTRARG